MNKTEYNREYYRKNYAKKRWYTRERADTPKSSGRPSREAVFWAAGFLDGEGYFGFIDRGTTNPEIRLEATQVDIWPLEKLQKLFGGRISKRKAYKETHSDYHKWVVSGARALGIMQTIYLAMSPRRQTDIRLGLAALKAKGVDVDAQLL